LRLEDRSNTRNGAADRDGGVSTRAAGSETGDRRPKRELLVIAELFGGVAWGRTDVAWPQCRD
jgi:hypothetical protein